MKTTFWLTAGAVMILVVAPLVPTSVFGLTPPAKTPELMSRGKKIFQEKCTYCHGAQGNAQTDAAKILNPPPRDFTQPLKDWAVSHGEPVKIFKVVKEGVPNSAMVKFDLPDADIWALVYTVMELSKHMQAGGESEKAGSAKREMNVPARKPGSPSS